MRYIFLALEKSILGALALLAAILLLAEIIVLTPIWLPPLVLRLSRRAL